VWGSMVGGGKDSHKLSGLRCCVMCLSCCGRKASCEYVYGWLSGWVAVCARHVCIMYVQSMSCVRWLFGRRALVGQELQPLDRKGGQSGKGDSGWREYYPWSLYHPAMLAGIRAAALSKARMGRQEHPLSLVAENCLIVF
jgi:hypothetical protein